jgi:hypothetical protein
VNPTLRADYSLQRLTSTLGRPACSTCDVAKAGDFAAGPEVEAGERQQLLQVLHTIAGYLLTVLQAQMPQPLQTCAT